MKGAFPLGRLGGAAAAALLCVAVLVSGCPLSEREYLELKAPVDDLAAKVARLERAVAEAPKGAPAPDAQVQRRVDDQGRGLADLRARVDELAAQVASLSGRVEILEKAGTREQDSARAGVGQLEARLAELERKLDRLQASSARPAEPAHVVAAPGPAAATAGGEKPATSAAPADKRSPVQTLYEEAYDLYRKQGKHEEAREKFRSLIVTYPEAALVPNAYFWIGQSYYDQGQYEPAILEYDNVIKKFPRSDKVASALLKEAFAFDKLNDPVSARAILKKLLRDHPKSDEAVIAQKKLEALGE